MKEYAKDLIALAIIMLFAYAYAINPHDEMLKTALVGALGVVTGYYLGGSKTGAETAAKNAETVSQAARSTNSEPQPVIVANDESTPVPVEAK